MLEWLHDAIVTTVGDHGYGAVFILMVLESACIPIPSEVTMVFGGALAATGFAAAGQELSITGVVIAGTVGNLIGSWIAYWAGAAGGRPLIDRFGRYVLIRPHEVDKASAWFERHGSAAVFFSRMLPVIRTFISVPAGVAKMPFVRFTIYTIVGCIPWNFGLAWAGQQLGTRWERVEDVLRPISWLIVVVCVIVVVWYVARRWTHVRAEYAALDAARAEETSGEPKA
jgi:membrane protein DedA with SNARE-associated domain